MLFATSCNKGSAIYYWLCSKTLGATLWRLRRLRTIKAQCSPPLLHARRRVCRLRLWKINILIGPCFFAAVGASTSCSIPKKKKKIFFLCVIVNVVEKYNSITPLSNYKYKVWLGKVNEVYEYPPIYDWLSKKQKKWMGQQSSMSSPLY